MKKLAILGEVGVGKTTIIKRLTQKNFESNTEPTANALRDEYSFTLNNKTVSLYLWDTPGQIEFVGVMPLTYKNADIIVLTFDLTNIETLNGLDKYSKLINESTPQSKIILLGNKSDLEHQISTESIKNKSNEFKSIGFLEFSAMTGNGVDDLNELILTAVGEFIEDNEQLPLVSEITDLKIEHDHCC